MSGVSYVGTIHDVTNATMDRVADESPESIGKKVIIEAANNTPSKPRAGKQTTEHPLESHDAVATGVGYVGTEVGSVVVRSGRKIIAPITNSDRTGNTFRNFLTGGILKGYSARETDVSGGETGKVVDKHLS